MHEACVFARVPVMYVDERLEADQGQLPGELPQLYLGVPAELHEVLVSPEVLCKVNGARLYCRHCCVGLLRPRKRETENKKGSKKWGGVAPHFW